MRPIRLNGVRKSFPGSNGSRFVVFDRLDLDIPAGSTVAIVGASGCGKTTLLNILALLESCDAGQVFHGDRALSPDDAGHTPIGYLFQRDALFPWWTAKDNALLGLACNRPITAADHEKASRYFRDFGLAGFEDARPGTLSGGQRQRVALIQNLLPDPPVLFLDEPFAAIDFQTKLNLEELLLRVTRPADGNRPTTVLVTHDIEEAIALGDRIVVLGSPPSGIIRQIPVDLPTGSRLPAEVRKSAVMRELFDVIWRDLQPASVGGET